MGIGRWRWCCRRVPGQQLLVSAARPGAVGVQADVDGIQPSARCRCLLDWLRSKNIDVVVFDMDQTMSSGHCGVGLRKDSELEAATVLHSTPGFRLAVATGSDPEEYEVQGQSRETHILGPDLARELIERSCPEALDSFEVMIGFDCRLHGNKPEDKGKRFHMRQIAQHYQVPFDRMLLLDDASSNLENEDGWHGVLVRKKEGFRLEDCLGEAV